MAQNMFAVCECSISNYQHICTIIFVCLFVCLECFVPLETFYSFGDVTVAGEGFGVRIPSATDLSRKNR